MASSSQSATSKPPGFFQDTKDLIHNYQKTANMDFVTFRRVWKEMSFSLIHHGNPKDMEREEYTQRLFATALGFLYVSQPLIVRVGVLYCLYLLHSTQLLRPKALIRVSMATWQELLQLYEEIKQHKLTSAYHVFKKMHREGYFAFVATAHVGYAPPDPALGSEALRGNVELPPELLNADTLRGVVDIDTIDYLAKLYVSTKEHVSDLEPNSELPLSPLSVVGSDLAAELRSLISQSDRPYTRVPLPASSSNQPTLSSLPGVRTGGMSCLPGSATTRNETVGLEPPLKSARTGSHENNMTGTDEG